MITKENVIEVLRKEQPYLKKEFGVKRMAIFGSFATDTATKDSDVDIYIEFDKVPGLKFIQLADYLDQRLERRTEILTPAGIDSIRHKEISQSIRQSLEYV